MSVIAAEDAPSKRIRWKAGKEDELWDYMQKRVAEGAGVSEALKEFAQENGISWLTARWKYYRLKQDKEPARNDPAPAPCTPAPAVDTVAAQGFRGPAAAGEPADGDAAFRALNAFLKSASSLDCVDLGGLLRGLAGLAEMALAGRGVAGELAALRSNHEQMAQRVRAYELQMGAVSERLTEIRTMVGDWLKTPGIDRVTSLDDFAGRLTAALDGLEALVTAAGREVRAAD